MGLWFKLNRLAHLEVPALPDNAEEFRKQWVESHITQIAFFGMFVGVVFHGINLFTDFFLVTNPLYHRVLMWCHLLFLSSVVVLLTVRNRLDRRIPLFVLWLQFLTYGGYLFILWHLALTENPIVNMKFMRAWTAYIGISFFIVILFPFKDRTVFFYATALWVSQSLVWLFIPEGSRMIAITSFIFYGGALLHTGQFWQVRREAMREYRARKKVADLERARHEKELILAREIQDSLAPPDELQIGRIKARCLQLKHDKVGGDWVAMRKNTNGDIIIAVADATGKGLQAALVVHAVQSLWAEALDYQNFQADKWLYRVNKALFRLGVNQPHSMTMGIIILSSHELVYWSAGHLPLFAVHRDKEGRGMTVTPTCAKGNLLGISKEIHLKPARFYFGDLKQLTILLGTDGVFDKGSRHNKRDILELVDRIKVKKYRALDDIDIADDKSLVFMKSTAA